MHLLSLLLRLLAISAAVITIGFYFRGGNQLKDTRSQLLEQQSLAARLQLSLAREKEQQLALQERNDAMTVELTTLRRDKRLSESEVLLVQNELKELRQKLNALSDAKQALVETHEQLRRETIELKSQGFDATHDPRQLTAQIETHRTRIRELEAELMDAQTVLRGLFKVSSAPTSKVPPAPTTNRARIHRIASEHQLLVLEMSPMEGIQENAVLHLLQEGVEVAKVRVARITPDLCVVKILSSSESRARVLQPGVQLDYILPFDRHEKDS